MRRDPEVVVGASNGSALRQTRSRLRPALGVITAVALAGILMGAATTGAPSPQPRDAGNSVAFSPEGGAVGPDAPTIMYLPPPQTTLSTDAALTTSVSTTQNQNFVGTSDGSANTH